MIKDSSDDRGSSGIFGFLFGTKPKPESKPIEIKKDDSNTIKVTEEISEREMQQIKLISTYNEVKRQIFHKKSTIKFIL